MKSNKPPLKIKNLKKSFNTGFLNMKRVKAVSGLSLTLKKGEIFGLLGPNGAGKTTTLKMITALIFPDKGSIEIFGKPPSSVSARKRIGFLPENPWFYDYLTAKEFLLMAAGIFGIKSDLAKERITKLLDQLGISHVADVPLRKFSKGMLQRAGLAQALINDPDLIILDEPLSGLDPIGRRELREIILDLKNRGKTVLFSSHILSDVEEMCDRVAIISKGTLKTIGDLESLLAKGQSETEIEIHSTISEIEKILSNHKITQFQKSISGLRLAIPPQIKTAPLLKELIDNNIEIISVKPHRRSLEDIFIEINDIVEEKK
jgi:ABC-2 type transport system ATP-binding protein